MSQILGSGGGGGTVTSVTGGTNINITGTATDPIVNLDSTITLTAVLATTFDTNVAAAGVTLAGTSLIADGTDANIDINITSKGSGQVIIDDLQLTTDLEVQYGGTGVSTLTDHGVLIGSGASAITALAVGTDGQVLLGSTGADPVWGQVDLTADVTGILPVPNGGTGLATITDHGVMVGSGVGVVTPLAVGTDGQVLVGSSGADPVFATISSTDGTIDITGGAGTLDLDLSSDVQMTGINSWNGAILETAAVTVTSDGATITFSVEQNGGGDLTVVFSDGYYTWDTTPADTVSLTAGSDTSPQINYIYFLQSTKTLTASTVGWPVTEHAPLATVLCQSAASLQTDGAYKVHAWTDHVVSTDNMGHIAHLNEWIRSQNATWQSGVAQTLTITPNGGAPDNVIFTTASGIVLQLHDHTFPAFAGTPDVYTVNDSVTPYNVVTDLNALLTDSTGASMSGSYFSLVIWGVVSEATGDCKLMVNLPSGSYSTQAQLEADASQYANYLIPSDFKGTGFLISELKLRHQVAASGTWTSISEIDLRGFFPSLAAGGSNSFATEFSDNVFRIFDDGDNTKELAFQVSPVTTATTRTITMCDADLDLTSPSFQGSVTAATGMTVTANDLDISSGSLTLPATTATDGQIIVNSTRWAHSYGGGGQVFIGNDAGNLTNSSCSGNVGIGGATLQGLTSGAIGNLAFGNSALTAVTSGDYNVGMGQFTLAAATTGSLNTACGSNALGQLITGSNNIGLGRANALAAGYSYTGAESYNICIANEGTVGESNKIRIGNSTDHNATYVAGIYGVTPGGTQNVALIDSNHQLGSVATLGVALGGTGAATLTDHGVLVGSGTGAVTPLAVGTNGQVLVGSTGADPVFATISDGTGITTTLGAGTLEISSTGTTLRNETGTTYTLALTDAGKFITFTNAAAITVTVPTNAAVAFPIGTQIGFMQGGAGQATFSGAVPPTLRSADSALTTVKIYSVGYMIKIATDEWAFGGDLQA